MTLTLREITETPIYELETPSLPKAVLVVAGSRAQFNFWVHAHQAPNAVYLHSPHQLRGLGPEHVERIDFVGTWWRSEVVRDYASMGMLMCLHAEVCGDPLSPLQGYGEATRVTPRPTLPCQCSADGGGCAVCAAMGGERMERPHFVRFDVRSPTIGKGRKGDAES